MGGWELHWSFSIIEFAISNGLKMGAGSAEMSGSEQIILSVLGTVVSGVLVYWLTVGLSRRRTHAAAADTTLGNAKVSRPRSLLDKLSNRSSFKGDMKAQLEEALAVPDKVVKNAVLDKLVEIFISKADFKSAEAAAMGLEAWNLPGRPFEHGAFGQDFKGKLNLAKALHSNHRYSDAARIIASIIQPSYWREKASKEVFGEEKK